MAFYVNFWFGLVGRGFNIFKDIETGLVIIYPVFYTVEELDCLVSRAVDYARDYETMMSSDELSKINAYFSLEIKAAREGIFLS